MRVCRVVRRRYAIMPGENRCDATVKDKGDCLKRVRINTRRRKILTADKQGDKRGFTQVLPS
jgi:hypothetical protein